MNNLYFETAPVLTLFLNLTFPFPSSLTFNRGLSGGDYLVEILGRYLNVYGVGAIKFVDKQWNAQKALDVHTVKFSYINFNSISPIIGRIKVRFPNVENYVFRETNIVCLGQLVITDLMCKNSVDVYIKWDFF